MTIRKKVLILLSLNFFILSLFIFTNLYLFYIFKKHTHYLETTDNLIDRVLQIRRYEKNIFLRWTQKNKNPYLEIEKNLKEIKFNLESLKKGGFKDQKIEELELAFKDYMEIFYLLDREAKNLEFIIENKFKKKSEPYNLLISAFLAHPVEALNFLKFYTSVTPEEEKAFLEFDQNLQKLRNIGERLIILTKELDIHSRIKVERRIELLKYIQSFLFIFFILVGVIGTLLLVKSILNRLNILDQLIEDASKGDFKKHQIIKISDELDLILYKVNIMEEKLKERDQLLEKQREKLYHSQKMAALGRFLSKVTHELNNPINNLYLTVQYFEKQLEKELDKETIKEYLKDLKCQVRIIKQTLDNFIIFSKKGVIKKYSVNLVEFIQKVWEDFRKTYTDINIEFEIIANDSVILEIDPFLFEKVFVNLFKNAYEAMDGKGKLKVSLEKKSQEIYIEVSDTGKGIPPEIRENLFEPFVTSKSNGLGLGLSIIREIIQKHGGDIYVKETSPSGTTFVIVLPITQS